MAKGKGKGRKKMTKAGRRKAIKHLPLSMLKSNLVKLSRIIQEHPDNQ